MEKIELNNGLECSVIGIGTFMLSPAEAVLGFKSRRKISEEDLQNVLAGTSSAHSIQSESIAVPSYVVVRAGIFGDDAKQLCGYVPYNDVRDSLRVFDV